MAFDLESLVAPIDGSPARAAEQGRGDAAGHRVRARPDAREPRPAPRSSAIARVLFAIDAASPDDTARQLDDLTTVAAPYLHTALTNDIRLSRRGKLPVVREFDAGTRWTARVVRSPVPPLDAHHLMEGDFMRRRLLPILVIVPAVLIMTASAAGACGGLVGENGTIQLTRTTTLAAYHDGVERYVTSFEFTGQGEEVGSIVPLPDVPTKVERGGDWTLQRLAARGGATGAERFAAAAALGCRRRGGGDPRDEDRRARHHHPEGRGRRGRRSGPSSTASCSHPTRPRCSTFYASRSPIFMAARFDAIRARDLGQQTGDGTPIMLTIPTDEPWVPVRILALGLERKAKVVTPTCSCSPTTARSCWPAATASSSDAQRARVAAAARRPALRQGHGLGARAHVVHVPPGRRARGELDYDLAVSTHRRRDPVGTRGRLRLPRRPAPARARRRQHGAWWGALLVIAVIGTFVALRVRVAWRSTAAS